AVALAEAEAHDSGIAALALSEAGAERVEQLLHRFGRFQECGGLPPGVQCIALAQRDHLVDQRFYCLSLRHRSDDTLLQDHRGDQVLKQRLARAHVALELRSSSQMSHVCSYSAIWSSVSSSPGPRPLPLSIPALGPAAGGISRPCWSIFIPSDKPIVDRI